MNMHPRVCLVPAEGRRECQIHGNWSYRQLLSHQVIERVLGFKLGSSGEVASAISHSHLSSSGFDAMDSVAGLRIT